MRGGKFEVHIEGIIPEIALAGEEGMRFGEFMRIVQHFRDQHTGKPVDKKDIASHGSSSHVADASQHTAPLSPNAGDPNPDPDIATVRWAWDWLRSRPEILINGNKRWNRLKLDQVLDLPEEPEQVDGPSEDVALEDAPDSSSISPKKIETPTAVKSMKSTKPKKKLTSRPRIHASEDLIWKTIAHHSVDYKRIPPKEWQCLLGIASVREEGILQGDLTRLVGQDKRSLPKRTDALASKGYIVKRTTVARRVKTSRLWLVDFAPAMVREDSNKEVDLSEENLRADLEPVPWRNRWTGENIDMESLGRTFLAIVQAWNVMRYNHVKIKMGIHELRWQMQVLAKLCRRFVDMGILGYTAAKLSVSGKVYKDCVKFLREPDQEEWDKLLATGKKNSQYSSENGLREPKPDTLSFPLKQDDAHEGADDGEEDDEAQVDVPIRRRLAWVPEKPVANIIFDVIDQAGSTGVTNPQLSVAVAGYQFHRFMGNVLTRLAETLQPPHLQHFQVKSDLVRLGKVSSYLFVASKNAEGALDQEAIRADEHTGRQDTDIVMADVPAPSSSTSQYGFGKIYRRSFADTTASLTSLTKTAGKQRLVGKKKDLLPKRGRKRGMPDDSEGSDVPETSHAPPMLARTENVEDEALPGNSSIPDTSTIDVAVDDLGNRRLVEEMLPGKPPGAYIGTPGSLNPPRKKQGRPRKSQVVIFKLEQLKDPSFLSASQVGQHGQAAQSEDSVSNHDQAAQDCVEVRTPTPATSFKAANTPKTSTPVDRPLLGPGSGRGRKKKTAGAFVCETCGDSWKNDLGLKYHLTKSQTTCNPDYDPAAIIEEKQRRKRQRLVSPTPVPDASNSNIPSTSKDTIPDSSQPIRVMQPATPRPSIRRVARPYQMAGQGFRGLDTGDVRVARDKLAQELANKGVGKLAQPSPASRKARGSSRPWPGTERQGQTLNRAASKTKAKATARETRVQGDAIPDVDASPALELEQPRMRAYQEAPEIKSQSGEPNATSNSTVITPTPQSKLTDSAHDSTTRSFPDKTNKMVAAYDDSTVSHLDDDIQQQPRELVPFEPQRNYDTIPSTSKRRHAQLSDIVNYVLDNCNGAFPGGKPLFFTALKIFLETFEEAPLTWAFHQKAMKRMDTEKQIASHVHLLRNRNGRMDTYTIVVRHGVDLNSHLVSKLKQCVRDAHPKMFIPEPFSFTDEEIAALEELFEAGEDDQPESSKTISKHGPYFRLRRAQIQDVEVLDAPYYEQQSEKFKEAAAEDSFESPTKRPKRPSSATNNVHATKRRKTVHDKPTASDQPGGSPEKRTTSTPSRSKRLEMPEATGGEMDPDSGAHVPQGVGSRGVSMEPEDGDTELFVPGQKLSVAQAIKVYGLLPMKGRPNGLLRPRVKKLSKLSANLGRSRNPGLRTLPGGFFPGATRRQGTSAIPTELEFLEPNTRLGDSDTEDDAFSPPSSKSSPAPGGCDPRSREESSEAEPNKEVVFTPFSAITKCAGDHWGVYPTLDAAFFEKDDTSYVLEGWLPDLGWFFRQHMPQSLDQMLKLTPGPAGKPQTWTDPEYGRFCATVDRCSRWELSAKWQASLLSGQSLAPNYRFINLSPPETKSNMISSILEWEDDNQYDLETLPYDELDAFMQDDGIDYDTGKGKSGLKPKACDLPNTLPQSKTARRAIASQIGRKMDRSKVEIEFIRKKRPLTVFPASPSDFIRTLEEDRNQDYWKSEHTRLIAFVVVKTLLGGVSSVVDWGLLMRLFPSQSAAQLRRFWTGARKDRQSTITALTEKFRKAFIVAYEKNEVPPIDFNNVANYDWKFVIEWACNLSNTIDESVELPVTRKALEQRYIMNEREVTDREWRERYFVSTRSVHHRLQDVTSEPIALPVDRSVAVPDADNTMMDVAMSWVRSLCVTPDDQYSNEAVARKLETLCGLEPDKVDALLNRAHRQLQAEKVVTKSTLRHSYERGWRLNNRVVAAMEKGSKLEQFAQATAYKKDLDAAFQSGEKKRVTYITDDGMIMALINLQACGRICVETTGQPKVPLGFEPGNYETRKFPKRYYHFRLDVSPTDEYIYDTDEDMIELRERIKAAGPPVLGNAGLIPIWCDLFGTVDKERWLQYLGLVLFTLASRGAMRAKEITKILKSTLMEFEAQMILDWGTHLGIIGVPFAGSAPAIKEWWWIAVDAQIEAFDANKARRKLPTSRENGGDECE